MTTQPELLHLIKETLSSYQELAKYQKQGADFLPLPKEVKVRWHSTLIDEWGEPLPLGKEATWSPELEDWEDLIETILEGCFNGQEIQAAVEDYNAKMARARYAIIATYGFDGETEFWELASTSPERAIEWCAARAKVNQERERSQLIQSIKRGEEELKSLRAKLEAMEKE